MAQANGISAKVSTFTRIYGVESTPKSTETSSSCRVAHFKAATSSFISSLLAPPLEGLSKLRSRVITSVKNTISLLKAVGNGLVFGTFTGQVGGALAGAAIGFCVGTAFGPATALIGTAIGAGVGFGVGGLSGGGLGVAIPLMLKKTSSTRKKIQTLVLENTQLTTELETLKRTKAAAAAA